MDPDGGSYDLKITSSDPNWSDFTTTNIKFRGGSAAVGAEDVLINRFNIPGTTPAWVDDLSISSTIVPEPSTITFLAGLSCQVFLRPFRLGVTGTVLEVAEEAQETNRER